MCPTFLVLFSCKFFISMHIFWQWKKHHATWLTLSKSWNLFYRYGHYQGIRWHQFAMHHLQSMYHACKTINSWQEWEIFSFLSVLLSQCWDEEGLNIWNWDSVKVTHEKNVGLKPKVTRQLNDSVKKHHADFILPSVKGVFFKRTPKKTQKNQLRQ